MTRTYLILSLLVLFLLNTKSQHNGLSFQGIARNGSGVALSGQNVNVKFSIGEINKTPMFEEIQTTISTDAFGVFTSIIGSVDIAEFKSIDFSKNLMLKVSIKLDGENFVEISNSQITKVPVAQYAIKSFFPAGMIIPFAGPKDNIPEGWKLCNGTSLDPIVYKPLFVAIGFAWGNDNGNFRLPDLRGTFLRGVVGERKLKAYPTIGYDPNSTSRTSIYDGGNSGNKVGSVQESGYQSHTHVINESGEHFHNYWMSKGGAWAQNKSYDFVNDYPGVSAGSLYEAPYTPTANSGKHTHTASHVGIGYETRPVNAYVNYIIKL